MAPHELLMNIDIVRADRDRRVLLAHTEDTFSLGVIRTPLVDTVLVASFRRPFVRMGVPLSFQFLRGAVDILVAQNDRHAMDLALKVLHGWVRSKSEDRKVRVFSPNDFTEYVKDAQVGEPQFRRLGGGLLSKKEALTRSAEFGRIRDTGFALPPGAIVMEHLRRNKPPKAGG